MVLSSILSFTTRIEEVSFIASVATRFAFAFCKPETWSNCHVDAKSLSVRDVRRFGTLLAKIWKDARIIHLAEHNHWLAHCGCADVVLEWTWRPSSCASYPGITPAILGEDRVLSSARAVSQRISMEFRATGRLPPFLVGFSSSNHPLAIRAALERREYAELFGAKVLLLNILPLTGTAPLRAGRLYYNHLNVSATTPLHFPAALSGSPNRNTNFSLQIELLDTRLIVGINGIAWTSFNFYQTTFELFEDLLSADSMFAVVVFGGNNDFESLFVSPMPSAYGHSSLMAPFF